MRTRRPPTTSAPDAAAEAGGGDPPARTDGRRTHVVDRAADYVALADAGLTVARIARRRRRSKGYVSILLRFGRLLAALPADERAAMRSPRITWALAQRLMRADTDVASARAQLRYALGGFGTATLGPSGAGAPRPGRRPAARPAAGAAPGPAAPWSTSPAAPADGVPARAPVAWGWDAAWFARDPAGFAHAHLAHFAHLHRVVATRARRAATAPPDVGQSIRALNRRLTTHAGAPGAGAPTDPATVYALAALDVLARKLAEAADEARRLADDAGLVVGDAGGSASPRSVPAAGPASGGRTSPRSATPVAILDGEPHAPADPLADPLADALAADLAD
jgi:hypothetical protein